MIQSQALIGQWRVMSARQSETSSAVRPHHNPSATCTRAKKVKLPSKILNIRQIFMLVEVWLWLVDSNYEM